MNAETFVMFVVEDDGKKRLQFNAPVRYSKFVDRLGIGQELRCVLSDPARGIKRNSKLHAILDEAAEALGWEDREEFKEQVLLRLRPDGVDEITGFPRRKKTRHMTDDEIDSLCMELKAFVWHLMPGFIFAYDRESAA
jgi:hypothetical protein